MKKEKQYVYRIKDLNSGLYYKKRIYARSDESQLVRDSILKEVKYRYTQKSYWGTEYEYGLIMDKVGHHYPTKRGADKMISEFTNSNVHQRKTSAGRILNARFNFVVVKSEVKYIDVSLNETEEQLTLGE